MLSGLCKAPPMMRAKPGAAGHAGSAPAASPTAPAGALRAPPSAPRCVQRSKGSRNTRDRSSVPSVSGRCASSSSCLICLNVLSKILRLRAAPDRCYPDCGSPFVREEDQNARNIRKHGVSFPLPRGYLRTDPGRDAPIPYTVGTGSAAAPSVRSAMRRRRPIAAGLTGRGVTADSGPAAAIRGPNRKARLILYPEQTNTENTDAAISSAQTVPCPEGAKRI